jgi:hypothetical protein
MFTDVLQEHVASVFSVEHTKRGKSVMDIGRDTGELGALRNICHIEEEGSSETLVPICKTTQHHILKDYSLKENQ